MISSLKEISDCSPFIPQMGALTTQTATSPTTCDTATAMSQTWSTVIRDSEGRWGHLRQREKTLEKMTPRQQ